MSTYCNSNKNRQQYKYKLIIDNSTYKYNKKKDLVEKIEKDFNITGVKHWITELKVPTIYHNKFNYIEFNGKIIHSIKNKTYKFNVTIDDKVYSDDRKFNLINTIEKELNINGVRKWYEHGTIPYKYHNKFKIVKLNELEIYNKLNRNYRASIKIDGVEYNSNSKCELIYELENKYNFPNAAIWFEKLRVTKNDSEKYKEVVVNGQVIHPRVVRGFI